MAGNNSHMRVSERTGFSCQSGKLGPKSVWKTFFPQQRKLMWSSAQNSPGMHWCRRRVRFRRIPEKVGDALGQSQVRFNRVLGKVPEKIPEKVEEPSVVVRFNRVPEKVLEKVPERKLWCRARSGSTGFRSNRVPKKVPVKVWEALVESQVKFNRVPEKVPEKVWEALVQSQVKFNRVPKQVPEKVPGGSGAADSLRGFGAEPSQVQQGSGSGSGRLWCRARSSSTGFGEGSTRFGRSGSTGFRRTDFGAEPGQVPRRFRRRSGRLWCARGGFGAV